MKSTFVVMRNFILFLCLGACVIACSSDDDEDIIEPEPPATTAERTVLLYIAAENSLARYVNFDLLELKEGIASSLPENNNMVVFTDDTSFPYICRYSNQSGVVRCDTIKKYEKDFLSTDSVQFEAVLKYVFDAFPAHSYALVVWSHGDGWLLDPNRAPAVRSIGIDNGENTNNNSGMRLQIEELERAISLLDLKFDYIFFDACFMQGVEVAYTLRNCADYIIASPAEIPGFGAPYQLMVQPMFAQPADIAGMVNAYYSYYNDNIIMDGSTRYGALLSAIKCSEMENLAAATAPLVIKYFQKENMPDLSGVQRYYPYISKYRPEYYDINGVMHAVATFDEYSTWKEQLDKTVPYAQATSFWYSLLGYQTTDLDYYSGVSCFVPKTVYPFLNDFHAVSWYYAAGWWGNTGW